jgi:hypothetical protein
MGGSISTSDPTDFIIKREIKYWSYYEIIIFFKKHKIGTETIYQKFKEHRIEGDILEEMTDEYLIKLGFEESDIIRFRREISKLQKEKQDIIKEINDKTLGDFTKENEITKTILSKKRKSTDLSIQKEVTVEKVLPKTSSLIENKVKKYEDKSDTEKPLKKLTDISERTDVCDENSENSDDTEKSLIIEKVEQI